MRFFKHGATALGLLLLIFMVQHSYANSALRSFTKLFHTSSNKCVHPLRRSIQDGTRLVFHSDDCQSHDTRLFLTPNANGSIRHTLTGKCVQPLGGSTLPGNNTELVLNTDCSSKAVLFEHLPNGAIRHRASGKCIHPLGGSDNPRNDTRLVLYDGCDGSGIRMNFHYSNEHTNLWFRGQ